jgi:hypothetical protein
VLNTIYEFRKVGFCVVNIDRGRHISADKLN